MRISLHHATDKPCEVAKSGGFATVVMKFVVWRTRGCASGSAVCCHCLLGHHAVAANSAATGTSFLFQGPAGPQAQGPELRSQG